MLEKLEHGGQMGHAKLPADLEHVLEALARNDTYLRERFELVSDQLAKCYALGSASPSRAGPDQDADDARKCLGQYSRLVETLGERLQQVRAAAQRRERLAAISSAAKAAEGGASGDDDVIDDSSPFGGEPDWDAALEHTTGQRHRGRQQRVGDGWEVDSDGSASDAGRRRSAVGRAATAEGAEAAEEAEVLEGLESFTSDLHARSQSIADKLRRDKDTLASMIPKVEQNVGGVSGTNRRLQQSSDASWGTMWYAGQLLLLATLLFVVAYLTIRIMPKW